MTDEIRLFEQATLSGNTEFLVANMSQVPPITNFLTLLTPFAVAEMQLTKRRLTALRALKGLPLDVVRRIVCAANISPYGYMSQLNSNEHGSRI